MKMITYLLLIFFLISCGKDELSDTIVGQWQLSSLTISACPDSVNNVPQTTSDSNGCLTVNGTMACQMVVFNADGTAVNTSTTNGMTMTQNLTYTVNNENNTVTSIDVGGNTNTFAVSDDIITLINPFGDCTITSQLTKL